MAEQMKAYESKYLVIEDDATESPGGIMIPSTVDAQKFHGYGTIHSAGAGRVSEEGTTIKPRLKKGDRVVFIKHSQMMIERDEITYFVLTDHEIVATLSPAS